ncbi:MAG: family 78 glycoside hydrolase catalytic domain, partial [Spirochaetales bacterium]|nr:family 78 glycoside hydrolase catalytic domain [Spirochaetales bacterium]
MKLKIKDLKCEYRSNPLGLDCEKPRFFWKIESGDQNCFQKSYRIRVYRDALPGQNGEDELLWDTGVVESGDSIQIPYEGPALEPRRAYSWEVMITDREGNSSPWSSRERWETGLMESGNWQARWISSPDKSIESPCFRKDFALDKELVSARLYASSRGLYRVMINGNQVTDDLFTPGWTEYRSRIQYQSYDVTALLASGENTLSSMLGNGWFRGSLGFAGGGAVYGDTLEMICQLHLTYSDGSEETVCSGEGWKCSEGAVRYSDLYHGEIYDSLMEPEGWKIPGFDDSQWSSAVVTDTPCTLLTAQESEAVRRTCEISVQEVLRSPKGETILDFGQNLVGWVRFSVKGKRGDKIKLSHAEILDGEGNFYTGNLRSARQQIEYTLKGEETEVYEPFFSFQGFRYVRIDESPESFDPAKGCTAVVLHTDMEPTGTFSCSHPLINQLQHNILWGQKGNFLDVPTDCPQRDERLGWTGDAQVFAGTACYNMNGALFFTKWLNDLKTAQRANGSVPAVVTAMPETALMMPEDSGAGWGDAAVIVPWNIYLAYGDRRLLEDQYPVMKGYVDYIRSRAEEGLLWNSGEHFGDWLALDAKPGSYKGATPDDLVATAYYAHSADILSRAATALGNKEDALEYRELNGQIKEAFCQEYLTPRGRISSETQTAHIMALYFDLVPQEHRLRLAVSLISNLFENKWHLSTGFLGTPLLCPALSLVGREDAAFRLLLQEEYPSWLYQVRKGATTIWEHWDGIKPDGSMWSDDMNSFNHYAYGAIGEWMYRNLGGIRQDERAPGYR